MNISAQTLTGFSKATPLARTGPYGDQQSGNFSDDAATGEASNFASLMNEGEAVKSTTATQDNLQQDEYSNQENLEEGADLLSVDEMTLEEIEALPNLETDSIQTQDEFQPIKEEIDFNPNKNDSPTLLDTNLDIQSEQDILPSEINAAAIAATTANPTSVPQVSANMLSAPSLTSAAATLNTVASASLANAKPLANDAPRMFRDVAEPANPQTANTRDISALPNSIQQRSSNVLDLFVNNGPLNNASVNNAGANNSTQPANNPLSMFSTNSSSINNQPSFNVPNSVSMTNPILNQAGQIPVVPMSTISGISNHLLMQVHPAITDRSNAVENSLLTPVVQRSDKSIALQLVPRSLGVIDMKIVNQSGNIKITIETQTLEAQQLIKSETAAMLETFRNAGLKLEEFSINHNSRLEANNPNERAATNSGAGFQENMNNQNSELNDGSGQSDNEYGVNNIDIVDEATASQTVSQNETTRDGMYL